MLRLILAIMLLFPVVGLGQSKQKIKLIRIPSNRGVVSVVSQPLCPLRITRAELFTKIDGQYPIVRYVVENRSRSAVKYFSIAFAEKFSIPRWHRFGSGFTDGVGREDGKGPSQLKPGSTYSNWPEFEFEIVPINDDVLGILANKPEQRQLKFMGVGMVARVIFADGTRCENERTYNELYDLLNIEG